MSRYKRVIIDGVEWSLHRYVWVQAYGPIPDGMHVHHKNGDHLDNRLENLELLTPLEHSRHHNDKHPRVKVCEVCGAGYEPAPTKRARSKTCSRACLRALLSSQRGARKGTAKLTDDAVIAIRRRLATGERQKDLAAEYNVSTATMSNIARGRTWTHLSS